MLSPIHEEGESALKLDISPTQRDTCPQKSVPQMVGGHGPWQLRHWLLFLLACFLMSMHLFSVFPFSSAVDCSCNTIKDTLSSTVNTTKYQFFKENKTCFHGAFLNSKQNVQNCLNVNVVIYAKCVYFIGILLSGLSVSLLTSKCGKRKTSLASGLFLFVSSFAVAWAPNVATYLILRFLISYGMMNVYLISIASMTEFVGPEYILVYGLSGHIGWCIAHLALPLAVWFTGSWFGLSLAASSVAFILFVFLCFIPESVEAYLSKGLYARAQKVIRQAAWSNGYPTEDVEYFTENFGLQKTENDVRRKCIQADFKQCFQLFLKFLIGLSASFVYFAAIWFTDWRRVDRGSYFALAGTTEIASVLILLFFTCFLAPKHIWSAATVLASVSLLLLYAKSSDVSPISTPPYLLTMFFSSAAWALILVRTLFYHNSKAATRWSTVASGAGLCTGAILASLVDLQKFHGWNPKLFVIFGIPNLTLGCSIAVIPERFFEF